MNKPDWQKFFRGIVRFTIRWYILIIIVAIAAGAVAFPRMVKLYSNIDTDIANLLPEDYPSVKTVFKVRDKFKALAGMILVLEGPTIEETQATLKELSSYLAADPDITGVVYEKPGYDFFEKYALLYVDKSDLEEIDFRMDRRIQKEKLGSLYVDFEEGDSTDEEFKFGDIEEKYRKQYSSGATNRYYASDNGLLYTIYIKPTSETGGIKGQAVFYKHVREYVDAFMAKQDEGYKIYYTGSVRTRVEEYRALMKDLTTAGIISGIGIALVLLLFFRRVFAVGVMLLPLVFGIFVTFAISSFFFDAMNLVTAFLFMILMGLGIEIGIHFMSRYIEERRSGKDMEESLFAVLYHTGIGALTSSMTVAVTFLILTINDFKGFSEFGFIAGVGLIVNYIAYILVLPSLLVLAEKCKILALKRRVGFEIAEKKTDAKTRFPLPRFTLIGIAIMTILALVDIPRLQFEWKFKQLKAVIPAHEIAKKKQRETSKTVNNPAVVVVHNKQEADALKEAVVKLKNEHPETTAINAYKSYFDLVPDDQNEKLEIIRRMQKRLEDDTIKLVKGEQRRDLNRFKDQLAKTDTVKEEYIPESVRKLFWGDAMDPGEQVAYINPLTHMEMDNGRNAMRFSDEIGTIETPVGTFNPSSDAIVFADVLRTMMRDGKRAILLAFLCVFTIVYLDFRSFRITALVVSPIALGVLFMALFMYVFKIKFNFYNMVIAPTVVGTSIDNSVHLFHRFKEMGFKNLMGAVRSTGGAALLSSATNICGFLGLIFVNHMGLRSIGNLAVLGMLACLLTTLIFFPALLQFLSDRNAFFFLHDKKTVMKKKVDNKEIKDIVHASLISS